MSDSAQLGLNFSDKSPEKRIAVFDIETQLGADEVGGWNNSHLMKVAVAVVHDSMDDQFKVFYENDVPELISLLKKSDLVVGFNSRNFDYSVLKGYTDEPLAETLPTLDILEEVQKSIGFRVGLNNVAQATLGSAKTADGLQSLQWFKEGKLDLIADYCIQDVKVTRDIYKYGLERKELFYTKKGGRKTGFKVDFSRA